MLANHNKRIKGRANQNSKEESTTCAKRGKICKRSLTRETAKRAKTCYSCLGRESVQQLPRAGKRATVAKRGKTCVRWTRKLCEALENVKPGVAFFPLRVYHRWWNSWVMLTFVCVSFDGCTFILFAFLFLFYFRLSVDNITEEVKTLKSKIKNLEKAMKTGPKDVSAQFSDYIEVQCSCLSLCCWFLWQNTLRRVVTRVGLRQADEMLLGAGDEDGEIPPSLHSGETQARSRTDLRGRFVRSDMERLLEFSLCLEDSKQRYRSSFTLHNRSLHVKFSWSSLATRKILRRILGGYNITIDVQETQFSTSPSKSWN